jgi:uncharacterized repeat protein (TIGR01451 family)
VGGGISFEGAQLLLTDDTFSGNTAQGGNGGNGFGGPAGNGNNAVGGGLVVSADSAQLDHDTFSGNAAVGGAGGQGGTWFAPSVGTAGVAAGGGLFVGSASLSLSSTIVAGNTAASAPDVYGVVAYSDHSLIGNTAGSFGLSALDGDLLNVQPQLAPLGNYGGPTQTTPLLPGSPGIDAGATPSPLALGLQDWYQGQNNAADSAGANPGTLSGGVSYTGGIIGQAFQLDGSTGKVTVADSASLDPATFTVGGWFNLAKAPASGSEYILASKYDGNYHGWILRVNSSLQPTFSLLSSPSGNVNATSSAPLTLNAWHYLSATYDGTTATLYVDGKAAATASLPGGYTPSATELTVGAASWFNGGYTNGRADQFVLYNRALSAPEETSLYSGSAKALPTTLSGLSLWLAAENNTSDSAGPNPGTLNNVTFTGGRVGQAFYFNGQGSYVDLGTGPDIVGTGPFAVGAWVKTTSDGVIIQQRDPSNFNGEYQLAVSGGKVYWWDFGNSQYGFNFTSNKAVNDGKWHYVVGVRQADGSGQIYVDGKLDSSQAAAPVPLGSGFHVYLGEDVRDAVDIGPSAANNFVGQIDEAQIYNRALAPAEVQALFQSPGGGVTTDQRGYRRLVGSHTDVGATEYQYDLSVSGKAPGTIYVGGTGTYTLTVTNNGPDPVAGVTLTDALPAGLLFQSLTAPSGWTTTTPAVGQGGTVTATDTASLAPGATATFTLVVQENPSTPSGSTISNTVTVGPTTDDTAPGNNAATFKTAVQTKPVGVDIHGQPSDALAGQPIGTVVVAVVDADGHTLTDSDQLVTLSIATGPDGARLGGHTTVRAVHGIATFTDLTLNVAGAYTLEATGGQLTPDFSNPFTIRPADVTADVQVDRGTVEHSKSGVWEQTLTVTNTGDQTFTGPLALVINGLPAGVTLDNASGTYQGSPYVDALPASAALAPGRKLRLTLKFSAPAGQSLVDLLDNVQVLLGV